MHRRARIACGLALLFLMAVATRGLGDDASLAAEKAPRGAAALLKGN
jgi:hypothetical protein